MTKGSFEKLHASDRCLYGPRMLLLAGFSVEAQDKFETLLQWLGFSELPIVWATSDQRQSSVGDLVQLPHAAGKGQPSSLPRAVIAGGITEKELHNLMSGCRKAGMKHALWATLTPTSTTWPLGRLLNELAAERKALAAKKG